MTSRLEQAFEKAAALPPAVQDEIAEQWLEDIESEIAWRKTLEQPQERLSELARKALKQSAHGETVAKGFDEI